MSYQPYVTNTKKTQQQKTQHLNPVVTAGGATNAYATAQPVNVYQPASQHAYSSPTASGLSRPDATHNFSSSPYGPPIASSATTVPTSHTTSSPLPDFSKALDFPPPSKAQPIPVYAAPNNYGNKVAGYSSGNSNSSGAYTMPPASNPGYSPAVPIPINKLAASVGVAPSSPYETTIAPTNSLAYNSAPSGGLISQGNPRLCHKIDYEIKGHEMQIVEIELDPQETVIAEAGAMMFLDEGIDFKTKFGDGSTPKEGFFKKLMNAGGRLLMGESLFITHFTNKGGNKKARVAFAAPYPGTILPMNLQDLGGKLICQKDAFLCAAKGTKLSIHLNKKLGSGLFGGEGFILQKLQGDGMAFVHAGGMVIKRELRGEKLRVDTGCVVAFTEGINFDIQLVPGLKSIFGGGEGLFLATLQGRGTVWLQSLPFSRFADRVIQHAPSAGGRRRGEGSALTGGFGDLVNGDGFGFNL